jgi:hypothetical protein
MELNNTPVDLTPTKKPLAKKSREEIQKQFKYQRDKDRELVKGKFIFHEVPGGTLEFPFKKWGQDEVEIYTLVDGCIYSLPLGVAKHLNQNLWYPEYGYIQGEAGTTMGAGTAIGSSNLMRVSKKIRRASFQSLEFIDVDEEFTNTKIVPVEYLRDTNG